MVYTLRFFFLKCSLFHNSNLFGSCTIHILYTECAKIKKIILAPKGYKEVDQAIQETWFDSPPVLETHPVASGAHLVS